MRDRGMGRDVTGMFRLCSVPVGVDFVDNIRSH